MSSIWASVFGFVENYFPVTAKIAASLTAAACIGEFSVPFLMGIYVDTVSDNSVKVVILIAPCFSIRKSSYGSHLHAPFAAAFSSRSSTC